MSGPRSKFDLLDEYVNAMIRGEIPTRPTFDCPNCGGPARVWASPRGSLLSLSVRCPCSALELDGVSKWPQWENLLAAASQEAQADAVALMGYQRTSVLSSVWQTNGESISCPYCTAPLPTAKAKQCFVCGTDWHNPDDIFCRKNPEWNRFGLKWKEFYAVELCQDPSGKRYTKYLQVEGGLPDPHQVFKTTSFPAWQWVSWGYYGYADHVTTTTGEEFTFDAHGIWLTWAEVREMNRHLRGEVGRDRIAWATAVPPIFPPK